jgi:hypothetical protein
MEVVASDIKYLFKTAMEALKDTYSFLILSRSQSHNSQIWLFTQMIQLAIKWRYFTSHLCSTKFLPLHAQLQQTYRPEGPQPPSRPDGNPSLRPGKLEDQRVGEWGERGEPGGERRLAGCRSRGWSNATTCTDSGLGHAHRLRVCLVWEPSKM